MSEETMNNLQKILFEAPEAIAEKYFKDDLGNAFKCTSYQKEALRKIFLRENTKFIIAAATQSGKSEVIQELNITLNEKKTTFEKSKYEVERLSKEIEILSSKKPHEYQLYLDKLEELHEKVNSLEVKLRNDFMNYISVVINGRTPAEISNEQAKYNECVFKYLGERLGIIRYLDKEYEVDTIDLIKEIISTKIGKKIRLSDMGTGQSQSAYLVSRLNTSDNRKIIALFDEVAMMDEKSLEPIYEKFRALYKQNRLLVGVVVQKAKEIKVVSKIKE